MTSLAPVEESLSRVDVALGTVTADSSLATMALIGLAAAKDKPIYCDLLTVENLRRSELRQVGSNLTELISLSNASTCAKQEAVLSVKSNLELPTNADALGDDLSIINKQTVLNE